LLFAVGVALAFAVLATGCSTGSSTSSGDEGSASTASTTAAESTLVNVGDHRLFLSCKGQGEPTVIFESGLGDSSSQWMGAPSMLDWVSADTRVCAYDRAGVGHSEDWPKGEQPVSARDVANDLHAALAAGEIAPPYVLVGHSIGGVFVRMFTSAYPDEVAGMVLLDPATEFQYQGRFWRRERKVEHRAATTLPDGSTTIDLSSTVRDMRAATRIDAPLVVLTAGMSSDPRWVERAWMDYHDRVAAMSPDSVHAIAEEAGHYIQEDDPNVVIEAVRQVTLAARNGSELPACRQMFSAADVTCLSG
jgi:pimeloyl-ACP methyl ester carboxylesterase